MAFDDVTEEDELLDEEDRIERMRTDRLIPKDRPITFGPAPAETLPAGAIEARVISLHRGHFRAFADGQVYFVHLAKRMLIRERKYHTPVAVGDAVIVVPLPVLTANAEPRAQLVHVMERTTVLSRPAARHRKRRKGAAEDVEQLMVANVDLAVIVYPGKDELRSHLIDRLLIAAERGGLAHLVVFNKADLMGERRSEFEAALAEYAELGTPGLITSAVTGEGVAQLRDHIHNRISVFVGHSGVGKSSLLNAIQPGLHLRIGELNRKTGRGTHTTTAVQLLPLTIGGYVVDTPGIREFGLHDLSPDDVFKYYAEIAEAADRCRFRNCTHTGREPGCAVSEAVEAGTVSRSRYRSFLALFASLES